MEDRKTEVLRRIKRIRDARNLYYALQCDESAEADERGAAHDAWISAEAALGRNWEEVEESLGA